MPEDFTGDIPRKNHWPSSVPDDIKAICGYNYAVNKNYTSIGYSRGHLDPADNYDSNLEYMNETFSFANAAPQNQSFNGGLWISIENIERKLAEKNNGVTVITGIIHKGSKEKIKNNISVPVYFYKIVL